MMAIAPAAEAAYENPLIPNVKLRRIYAAMVRARLLDNALPKARRGESVRGLEACLTSTSVDLGSGDLVSDAVIGGAVDFLRGKAFRYVAGGTAKVLCDATLESVLQPSSKARRRGMTADCGTPLRLPATPEVEARLWAAMGAALALKAQHTYQRSQSKAKVATESGVVVVYARPSEASPAIWRRALAFAGEQLLPVLFVVLPATRGSAVAAKPFAMSTVAHRYGVPGMAVDADDAVALYRVAQEAIGRARIGGGAALMECVPFVLEGTKRRSQASADAIAGLEEYMLGRGIATRRWMEQEASLCAKRIAK
jgi:TPP-dependent pyruvate/acetoin dehydrogenase alpha subunit